MGLNGSQHVVISTDFVSANVVDQRNIDQVIGREFSGRMSINVNC